MIALAEARSALLSVLSPAEPADVRLGEALGLVLSRDVIARESVPSFVNSAMDGYALRSSDLLEVPGSLSVVAVTMAGDPPWSSLGPGEAVRIMTGAPLPDGADSVCMIEDTEASEDGRSVRIDRRAVPGQHVRRPGEDVRAGELLFCEGTVLTPRHLGVAASVGLSTVPVRGRARVGVLSTGNELRPPGVELGPGQIRESNRQLLLALVEEAGAVPVDLGLAPDEDDEVVNAILSGSRHCDLVLTSGGVSVGDKDVVRSVLDRLCPDCSSVLSVAIKPAKPLVYGRLVSGTVLIGLPGNPVSSLVSFECFVRPALSLLAGDDQPVGALVKAVAAEAFSRRPDGKLHLVGANLESGHDGRLFVRPLAGQASHRLRSVAGLDVLVHLPDGDGVSAGTVVDAQPVGRSFGFAQRGPVQPAQ